METLYSTSGFTSEASLSGRPHTPPHTPAKASKRRLRSDSPASTVGSIHPTETSSPRKKAAKRAVADEIKVEEIEEGDIGYVSDIDVVYPDELEENSSGSDQVDDATDASDDEDTHLTRRLSRLRCGNDQEVDFEVLRHQRHLEKRAGARLFKRTHSQSVTSESDASNVDAMDDHDHSSTQRRLRRRVRGPREADTGSKDVFRSSPEAGNFGAPPDGTKTKDTAVLTQQGDGMDVDEIQHGS